MLHPVFGLTQIRSEKQLSWKAWIHRFFHDLATGNNSILEQVLVPLLFGKIST
jgi:hypothetical protein